MICNLVTKAGTPDEALEMAKLISSKLVQHPDEKPQLRIKMYVRLFYFLSYLVIVGIMIDYAMLLQAIHFVQYAREPIQPVHCLHQSP